MKKILIPTDFSATAYNAAIFGLQIAAATHAEQVVLFNAFQTPVNVGPDPMVSTIEAFDFESIKKDAFSSLEIFKQNIAVHNTGKVDIKLLAESCILSVDIDSICNVNDIDLIIMGITGGTTLAEAFVGSNTLQVSKNTNVPLLIIPQDATFNPLQNILLVSDYNDVENSTPVGSISRILDDTKANLFILHIDEEYNDDEVKKSKAIDSLSKMFTNYTPEFYTGSNSSFVESVNDFIQLKGVDLVIIVPKKRGFPDNLLHQSYSKSLAFHTHIPLMLIKNKQQIN